MQKKNDLRTQDFKSKDPSYEITAILRRNSRNQSQIRGEDFFFRDDLVFEAKIEKSESFFFLGITTFLSQKSRNRNKFAHDQISAHTYTAKN